MSHFPLLFDSQDSLDLCIADVSEEIKVSPDFLAELICPLIHLCEVESLIDSVHWWELPHALNLTNCCIGVKDSI